MKVKSILFIFSLILTQLCFSQVQSNIGFSTFDQQSNASVGRKIISLGDGKYSAVWNFAADFTGGDPSRGTGYNFFDGSVWSTVPSARLESVRTGFPAIIRIGSSRELILSHLDSPFDFKMGKNTGSGSSFIWSNANATLQATPGNIATSFAKTASGGLDSNTIHLISIYNDNNISINGVQRPFVYSRSTDAGNSWAIQSTPLTGYSSVRTLHSYPDAYDIDASGNNVAIVLGGPAEDVTLWKSSNNGTSFTKTLVDTFIYAPDMIASAPLNDTVKTNDGAVSVLIDNAGKARIAYSYSKVYIGTGPVQHFLYNTIGLIYWDEINHVKVDIPIPFVNLDENGDTFYSIGSKTTDIGYARYQNSSLLTHPSIAMDASGAIYIVFSLPRDGDSTDDGQSYRDVWAVKSSNGGANWSCPVNITHSQGIEEAYPSVAKVVDEHLHILFQKDFEPGTKAVNGDGDDQQIITSMLVNKDFSDVFAPPIFGSRTFCLGDSTYLSTDLASNYLWSTNETSIGIYVHNPGWYSLHVTNACSFTGIDSVFVDYEPLPIAFIDVIGDTSFCVGHTPVGLNANFGHGYHWSNGSFAQTLQLGTVAQSGVYTVAVFNVCGDSTISAPVHISVHPLPAAPVIDQGFGFFTTTTTAATYQWYVDGVLIPGATSQTFTPSNDSITKGKQITLTITDSLGCSSSSNAVTGIKAIYEMDGFEMYPNPANQKVTIILNDVLQSSNQLIITDLLGRSLYVLSNNSSLLNNTIEIDVSLFEKGIYFVEYKNRIHRHVEKLIVY